MPAIPAPILRAAEALYQRQQDIQQHRLNLAGLAKLIDRRTIQTPALDLIDAELERLVATPDGRLIISMPPQEGKSTRVSRDFPIKILTNNPDMRIVCASYSQNLASRNGRAVRNSIISHPEIGITIARDNKSVSEWTLAGHKGGVLSVGRGTGVTGRSAEILIVDDPLKDRSEADSEIIRDLCWDWWTDSLSTRLAPGAPVVLILTRWHQDDLAGRLVNAPDGHLWRIINIPAQAESDDDPLGRQPGDYLISARGHRDWEAIKLRVGAQTWAALYQGHPSPVEGGLFKRDAWRYYDQPLWTPQPDGSCTVPGDGRLLMSWDMTFKDAATSDFVVGQVWLHRGPNMFLLDQVRKRMGFVDSLHAFEHLVAKWPQCAAKLVEDKANGTAIIDMLRQKIPGLTPVTPTESKQARANAITPFVEAHNVYLPADRIAPWVGETVEELSVFPNGAHDDQCDALTQALQHVYLGHAQGDAWLEWMRRKAAQKQQQKAGDHGGLAPTLA